MGEQHNRIGQTVHAWKFDALHTSKSQPVKRGRKKSRLEKS